LFAIYLSLVDGELGKPPVRFESDALRSLHALQRAGDGEGLAAQHFQLGARAEIVRRFFRPAEAGVRQAAEVIAARVAAAAGNRGGQQLVRPAVIAGKVGMHAASVQLIEQRVLGERR
jgi:hypothetical protein